MPPRGSSPPPPPPAAPTPPRVAAPGGRHRHRPPPRIAALSRRIRASEDRQLVVRFGSEQVVGARRHLRAPELVCIGRRRLLVLERGAWRAARFGGRLRRFLARFLLDLLVAERLRQSLERRRAIGESLFDRLAIPLAQRKHTGLYPNQGIVAIALFDQCREPRPHRDFGAFADVAQQIFSIATSVISL